MKRIVVILLVLACCCEETDTVSPQTQEPTAATEAPAEAEAERLAKKEAAARAERERLAEIHSKSEAQKAADRAKAEAREKVAKQKPIEEILAEVFVTNVVAWQYSENEVRGDELFKNVAFYITGKVTNISAGPSGGANVSLEGHSYVDCVCVFDDKDKSQVADLYTGHYVLVKGTCRGKRGDVVFTDCSLIAFKETPFRKVGQ